MLSGATVRHHTDHGLAALIKTLLHLSIVKPKGEGFCLTLRAEKRAKLAHPYGPAGPAPQQKPLDCRCPSAAPLQPNPWSSPGEHHRPPKLLINYCLLFNQRISVPSLISSERFFVRYNLLLISSPTHFPEHNSRADTEDKEKDRPSWESARCL